MSKMYIDITELHGWSGKLTGVPRVMNELATRYAADDVEFVIWDSSTQTFNRVEFERKDVTGAAGQAKSVGAEAEKSGLAVHPGVQLLKKAVRKSKVASKMVEVVRSRGKTDVGAALAVVVPEAGESLFVMADWHANDDAFVQRLQDLKAQGVSLIQICYDMLPIVMPQCSGHATAYFTNYVRKIYPLSDLVIAISENTRQDIERYLRAESLNVPKIGVIRLGDDFHRTKSSPPKDKQLLRKLSSRSFALCVGTIEARKNHTLLYYVYSLAARRGIELPPLVVVGRSGWLAHDVEQLITHDPVLVDKVMVLKDVSDNELTWLYERCSFTVYPSFYEGWGLPVAESVARGVPCACSQTSSLPEIAGKLVNYFDPYSPDSCLDVLQAMGQPQALERARRNLKAYTMTSWDTTFTSVDKMVKEVIHGQDS